ncbi:hypothetical protein [Mucilaginibacter kameinonensis]|uniref:hypothetical protein n=1 Tax=Mucilaginibacter kameinonensis TaxID=452286 RepID=UPI000EF82E65|nr:hypothetical protein [Mucilaginibacter kameinonensis]
MKLSRLIPALLLFSACNNTQHGGQLDNMPASELALIKRVEIADSAFLVNDSPIKKGEALKYHKAAILKFVQDTLQGNVKQWLAIVETIKTTPLLNDDYDINVRLLIPRNAYLNEEVPESGTIIFNAQIDSEDSVKNALKEMKDGDRVKVSGTFVRDIVKTIDFDNFMDPQEGFSSPAFKFNIQSITKRP